jgi:hypothetical protein
LAAKMNCKASRPESVWDAHPIGLLAIKWSTGGSESLFRQKCLINN